ncbi:MAG: M23 family metallopeptidase [Coriobacteriales bacterium]|nr:M23 family metallopeptidase [Coriobacteriales bacterium]
MPKRIQHNSGSRIDTPRRRTNPEKLYYPYDGANDSPQDYSRYQFYNSTVNFRDENERTRSETSRSYQRRLNHYNNEDNLSSNQQNSQRRVARLEHRQVSQTSSSQTNDSQNKFRRSNYRLDDEPIKRDAKHRRSKSSSSKRKQQDNGTVLFTENDDSLEPYSQANSRQINSLNADSDINQQSNKPNSNNYRRGEKRNSNYQNSHHYSEPEANGISLSQLKIRRLCVGIMTALIFVGIFCALFVLPSQPINSATNPQNNASVAAKPKLLPTPIMATSMGVNLHCAVTMQDLTEILIHNASYTYACPLETQLTEATNDDIIKAHGTGRDPNTQPTGENWMTGQFIRCFRSESKGPKLSAIDCGGPVGATVYSPVSGTVVKVKPYSLYNNDAYPDIEIHIQPDGHPELDVVLIHLENPCVKVGDRVKAGETSIATIRDVYAYIGDSMQLRNYTGKGDNGNHTHIQVNNANDPEYKGLSD